jgi:hypothetical protein
MSMMARATRYLLRHQLTYPFPSTTRRIDRIRTALSEQRMDICDLAPSSSLSQQSIVSHCFQIPAFRREAVCGLKYGLETESLCLMNTEARYNLVLGSI